MTTWTDDELGELLRGTFRDHETPDDTDDAQRIAWRTPTIRRRRPWPSVIAVAATVAVIAGIAGATTYAAKHLDSGGGTSGSTISGGTGSLAPVAAGPARAGTNAAAAQAEASRILGALSLPPGAKRVASTPSPHLVGLGVFVPGPGTVVRSQWYVASESVSQTRIWLLGHAQAGMTTPASGAGAGDDPLEWVGNAAMTYGQPVLAIRVRALGPGRTGIRVGVVITPRFDRTAATMAPSGVTSIEISKAPIDGPSAGRTTQRTTVTDAGTIAALVAAYDALPGALDQQMPCGSLTDIQYAYSFTMRSAAHTLVADQGSPLCGRGRGLTLDGRKLRQQVDNSEPFDQLLERTLAGADPAASAPAPNATAGGPPTRPRG